MTFASHLLAGVSAIVLLATSGPLAAQSLFTPVASEFSGTVRAAAQEQGAAIYAGSTVTIRGEGLVAGQELTLMRGTTVLNGDGPIVVPQDGKFTFTLTLDAEAATGLQPVVLLAENPAGAQIINVKVSPKLALVGAEKFDITSGPVAEGLYQVAFSAKENAVFVTSAVGRPPVKVSALTRLDAETLTQEAQGVPPSAPARKRSGAEGKAAEDGLFAVYGVDVDDTHGRVWVSNTRQDTIAVYDAKDLKLVKQFEPGAVAHGRDIFVDETRGRAYVASTGTNRIEVIDTSSLEKLAPIEITSGRRGGKWSSMALDLDEQGGVLVNVSMSSNEVAVIDLDSGDIKVWPLAGAKAASGVAYDPVEKLVFAVSQQSDNLIILKADTGEIVTNIPVGAQPLNVTFDPVSRQAFIANRGAGTITVVDTAGEVVANLDAGSRPNHLRADGQGRVWAVNKSIGSDDDRGNLIWQISPAK